MRAGLRVVQPGKFIAGCLRPEARAEKAVRDAG